jgi:hypothetical protein
LCLRGFLVGFIQPPFQGIAQLILRGLCSCSTRCLDVLANELPAAMDILYVPVRVVARYGANIQGPAFAGPRNVAVSEMSDVAGVHDSHLQQSDGLNAEQLGNSLGDHRGGLVAVENRNRWVAPGKIKLGHGEKPEGPRAAIHVQTLTLPHAETDGFAVHLDRFPVKLGHLGRQKRDSRKLKPTYCTFNLASQLDLVHVNLLDTPILPHVVQRVKSESMLIHVDFANRTNHQ